MRNRQSKVVAKEKGQLPRPFVPNVETVEAMKAARRDELVTAGGPTSLLGSLNADETTAVKIQSREALEAEMRAVARGEIPPPVDAQQPSMDPPRR